jgi:hypothetical protein
MRGINPGFPFSLNENGKLVPHHPVEGWWETSFGCLKMK